MSVFCCPPGHVTVSLRKPDFPGTRACLPVHGLGCGAGGLAGGGGGGCGSGCSGGGPPDCEGCGGTGTGGLGPVLVTVLYISGCVLPMWRAKSWSFPSSKPRVIMWTKRSPPRACALAISAGELANAVHPAMLPHTNSDTPPAGVVLPGFVVLLLMSTPGWAPLGETGFLLSGSQ